MRTESNVYSPRWFKLFHIGIGETRTIQEVDFVCACAPLPDFSRVLDVCCGIGRHARALTNRGYSVVGIDRAADIIAKALELGGGPAYLRADVRHYRPDAAVFDAVVVMSQSFGYFDATTNRDTLARLAASLREGGRVILDLWNPEFFATHQGERDLKTAGGMVRENKRMQGDRLFVHLDYPDGGREEFEWQLFSAAQMTFLAQSVGLNLLLCCTDYDSAIAPSPTNPRIQFLLERRA